MLEYPVHHARQSDSKNTNCDKWAEYHSSFTTKPSDVGDNDLL